MPQKTKKLSDRIKDALDSLVEALDHLVSPPPTPVPIRTGPRRLPPRRR